MPSTVMLVMFIADGAAQTGWPTAPQPAVSALILILPVADEPLLIPDHLA